MSAAAKTEAVGYYRRGWSPIPVKSRSKEPDLHKLAPYLSQRATKEELSSWSWPGVGIVTGGLSGILVLDVDGPEGEAELKKRGHPLTPMVRTAGGGLHLYFKHPEKDIRTGIRVAPGLDVKASGGYVVAPPSLGPNGKPYEWIVGLEEVDPADPPEWLTELLERPRFGAAPVGHRIPPGQRNKELASIAGSMRRRGLGEAEILAALSVANERRCDPPLEREEVRKIAASVSKYEPAGDVTPVSYNGRGTLQPPARFNLTDLGNAERFVVRHSEDVRYCFPWRKWLVWTGARWERDDTGHVHRLAKETVRGIYQEAAAAEDEDRRKALARHATHSEAESKIKGMVELAKSEVPVSPDDLDADPWRLNVPNGTVDLRTGELQSHRREDMQTKMAGAEYRPEAGAPTWASVLERVLPNPEVRTFFKKLCGYALSGDVSEHILPVLYGTGANGKSTVLNALLEAVGEYGMQAAPDLLIAKRGSHPTEVADLFGMRAVASIEVEDGRRLAEALVKSLTGGDRIRARRMRQDFWEFDPTHTAFLSTNHKPEIRGTDNAIWRRIRLIPFTETIPPEEQDKKLPEKLRAELSGILAWAVQGCLEWQREGLEAPDEVRKATGRYRAEMDVIGAFVRECCVVEPGCRESAEQVYKTYKDWCENSGEKPTTRLKFDERLRERGAFEVRRSGKNGAREWHGLELLTDETRPFAGKLTDRSSSDYKQPESGPRESYSQQPVSSSVASVGAPERPSVHPPFTVAEVLEELEKPGSGPAKTAATYLAGETQLEHVVRSVLFARRMDGEQWEHRAPVVEAAVKEWGSRE